MPTSAASALATCGVGVERRRAPVQREPLQTRAVTVTSTTTTVAWTPDRPRSPKPKGEGGYLNDGSAGFLIENTHGAVVVGEVVDGQARYDQAAGTAMPVGARRGTLQIVSLASPKSARSISASSAAVSAQRRPGRLSVSRMPLSA